MRLDYELTRMLRCAELQRKGFMLAENTRVYDMCSDVVPIVEYQAKKKTAVKQYLKKECTPKEKKFFWNEQEYECPTTKIKK
jgi:type III secretory pathway component EscR